MATNNNPFEKYLEASQRQGSNYNDLSQGIEKLRSEYETQRPDVVFKNKTINDYAQDLGISALKGSVLVPQIAVGLADIAGYGAEKVAQGYGELAALTGLVDRPQEVNYTGHLGKALADLGVDFKTTQEVLDRNYSDPYLQQQQELQALGEMNLDNGLFSQNNGDVLAAKAAYVLDNPSLAVNEIVTSLPLIGLGTVIGNAVKGVVTANLAARSSGTATQALNTANQAINNSVRTRIGLGALGEGAVSAGLSQETSRQHSDTGLTTPDQTMLSLAVGGGVGALGYLGGRAANRAGVEDIDSLLINTGANTTLKNNPVSRLVGAANREGLEEIPQENLENFGENLNTDRGDGNILYGSADSTVLGYAAGFGTGAGMHLPSAIADAASNVSTGLNKAKETIKDKATLKSYEEVSNPDSDNYDPVKAFNLQAKNLLSDDEALRTQAQVSVDELTTGLETKIDTAMQRRTELAQLLDARDPTDLSDETKVKYLGLQAEFDVISKSLPTLLSKYEQLAIAKDDLEKNKEKINGTTYTDEQAKQDIAVLSQEPKQQTVTWNYEGNEIPVTTVGSARVNEAGEEVIDISYNFDGIPLEVTVPTRELNLPDTTAQQQAIANVTKHFSKFSPEELEVISKSPYLSEQQRNSLRQLSAVKQHIAASSDIGKVRDHILNGLKGATPRDSHRGMNTYTDLVNTGIRNNDERLIDMALTELGDFAQHHTDKAKVINEAFAQVKQGETIRVARTKDGVWGMVKNPTTAKQNGEYDIHVNSNKVSANRPVGLIDAINQEVSIITDHYNALRGIAESFSLQAVEPTVTPPVTVEALREANKPVVPSNSTDSITSAITRLDKYNKSGTPLTVDSVTSEALQTIQAKVSSAFELGAVNQQTYDGVTKDIATLQQYLSSAKPNKQNQEVSKTNTTTQPSTKPNTQDVSNITENQKTGIWEESQISNLKRMIDSFVTINKITPEEYTQGKGSVYERAWALVKTAYSDAAKRITELMAKGITTVEDIEDLTQQLNKLYQYASQSIDLNSDRASLDKLTLNIDSLATVLFSDVDSKLIDEYLKQKEERVARRGDKLLTDWDGNKSFDGRTTEYVFNAPHLQDKKLSKVGDTLIVAQDNSNTANVDTKEYTNHSGGAYGADTLWDTVGRSLGFSNHNHYRDGANQTLSAKLKQAGVKAVALSKEQMEIARNKVQKLLNKAFPDTVQGNLQVRNYYQVANSDGVYAIAALKGNNAVKGGTNTAVQLGIKLDKPVYVWDISTEQWYKFDVKSKTFKPTETPVLSKNYAGVGTRDIENYNVLKDGKWVQREAYVGDVKAAKAQQAIKDVYEKTLAQSTVKAKENKVKQLNTNTAEVTAPVQTTEATPNSLDITTPVEPKPISENVKQFGYLGELLDDEDVEKVFKKEIEKILKLKADRASRKSPTFVSFDDLLTFNGGIEYFTRLAKNDPNISKLTKAANKLRDLMRIVQHQSTVEKYIDKSISAQDLKDYLNKYPELKSIFEELREQKHSSLVHAVAGDIQEAKDVLSAEMEKLITLVGLLYIRAAFEKGQQYLIDTNYADLSEVLFPYTVMLFSNKHSGYLQKNKVVWGDDTKTLRGLVTPTEAALIDKIDGIPVGELSKEDFEMVKALVQNVVNGYFNQYEVLQYPRNKKKVYSDIVHNIIVEHLPKEGFALENFTPEEVIKGAVPQSFIWDFKKQSSTPTQKAEIPDDLLAILSKYDEVLPYAKGEKSQNVFITTRGLISEAGKKVEKLIMSLGTEIANYFGLQYEDVRVNNNLGSLDAIRQYKLNGKAIGDAAVVAYKYLNTPQLFEELGNQDIPVVNKNSLANPVTELLKANLEPTEFLVKAKELGIVGAALEVAKGIYNRTKAKVSITKAVKENKAILQQIEDTKQDLRLYNFGLRGIKINITTDEGVFEDAYVSELSRTKNGEIDYKLQVESDYTGFKPNPVLKAELEQQLVDLPKQLKPLGKPNKYFKDYFDIETKAEPEVKSTEATAKIGETTTKVKGKFTTTKTVISDNTVLSVHTNNDTGEVTKSEYVTTYPDIYSDELGDKYTIVIYRDSANPSVITDVKSFDPKDKKNSTGSYGKQGNQTDEKFITTFTEAGDVTLEYPNKFEKSLPVVNTTTQQDTTTTNPVIAKIEAINSFEDLNNLLEEINIIDQSKLAVIEELNNEFVKLNDKDNLNDKEEVRFDFLDNLLSDLDVPLDTLVHSNSKEAYDTLKPYLVKDALEIVKAFKLKHDELSRKANEEAVYDKALSFLEKNKRMPINKITIPAFQAHKGYEVTIEDGDGYITGMLLKDGTWLRVGAAKAKPNDTTEKQTNDITEVVAESSVTIKTVGENTEVTNTTSGLTHRVPTVLLNKMLSVKYYLEQVLSVDSGTLKPKEKEYISKLLSVFTQLRPNVLVNFLTDFSRIDKKIAQDLPKAVGKSVDNKIYIDLTNKTPVDVLELLTHEYHHAVTAETLDKTPLNTSYHIELAKVHEAIIKYLEDNPTLSAKARKRLSYALINPRELLTVGTTEPIAIASLRNIDMGNGKTAYTIIMEQSIAVMKEQYSKTFTTEIEAQLNDLLSKTDRNSTTNEASSTKDSSIPSSEAASTTSDNTGTVDESTKLQSDSNTESTDAEVVNTTGLSVLQGLSKEVIAEERTKPLSIINLAKAYLSQKLNKDETKGTNPLVAVNNFMQSLPKTFNELRAYVSNYLEPNYKITDEQLKQLQQFKKFELGFSTIASNLFSNRYINDKYAPDAPTQNVILYFRDAKGNLDTNMLTAMAASAFQYLIVNGTKVGNKEEDVRKLLRLDAKAPLPYEVSSALRYVGADVKTVVRELGKSIYKSLGLSVDRQGDVDLQQRVELALGQLALDTLVESGYLKENLLDSTAITEISDAMIAAGYSTTNTLTKTNKLTFVSSNVVFNDKGNLVINDEGKVTFEALKPVNVGTKEEVVLPTVEAIKETNEGTVGFLQDLFSTDNGYRMPELLEPTKFVQDSIKGTDAKVSEYQKELLTEAHKHASTMRKNTISVLNKLKGIGDNSKYLRQLINAWYDKESLEKVHILRQDSVIVAAEDIWNKLENGLQWANIIAEPDGYAEFYSPQDVAQNSRMHTTATFFNEQANQVHRAMASKKEHNIILNLKPNNSEDLNNILRFFQAVGEGLEDLPLGSSINSQVPGYKFFTTDKVRGDHYVSSLLAYLFSEETKPAIDAMITLIENDTIDTEQQKAISKFVKAGGMGIQSLQSLIAIAEYFKAIKDGKTNIEINTPFSSDGVNDGVASTNILMGTATPELLQQVGMFLRQETGVQTESMQDNYMKGIEDYYVSFGNKIREALIRLANEKIDKEWAKATLALFTKLQLSKDDMKATRKIAKTWSVPFNYSAGKPALQRALARDFLENIYDQFESIGGEALDNRKAYAEAKRKKDNDSMAALEIAYAGLKRDVQTLETNIQNALGYGFLAPSSTKVRQVRGSLYRSLSAIELPVSRPENLLSFTFNTGSVEIIEVITTSNLDKNGKETSSTKNSFVHTGRDAERIIEKYLRSASTAMFGKASWEATEEFAGKFIASRDLFTEIQNSTFSLYNQLRNALIDAKIESKKDKTFGGYFTLTIAEMEEIDNKLLKFAPILKTVFSIKATSETDALASGLRLYDSTYTTSLPSERPDLRQVTTRYTKRNGKPATTTTNLGREVLEKGGVKNGATAIQSIDAFVSATVQAIFGILNAHDAGFFALDKFIQGTLLQNETYLEAMTKYHFGLEHIESLLRSYKGLESVVKSLGLEKSYQDKLYSLFENILFGEEAVDKTENVIFDDSGSVVRTGGLVGALNDMLLLEGKETFNSNGRDIEEVLQILTKTLIAKDIAKLNQLKQLHSVHHFSGEGGQVLVTEEHIKEMDKQIKLLKVKEKELLASITKEADRIAIDNKSITDYLIENKDKDIKYTVFKPYLELNSKPEHKAVLGLIEKLIPTGLTIRYQEQDIATEGYGNYDEKTNTITITAIPDSKVSIALVIHELLHSALAQRINTLQEAKKTGNTKGLEKAIEALDRVEALRETIIGKDGLEYLELKKVIEGKAKGKSFKDYKIELEALRTSLNAKLDKANNDYANTVKELKQVQADINELTKFFGLTTKLKQEQKEAAISQPTYTVVTGALDEAGNAVEKVVTRLSIINKFENIHEFISYGLTDRNVQAVLGSLTTPKETKFRKALNNLSVGFRKALYAFLEIMGLEPNASKLLVPLYTEVSKLIDEIVQANVQPTPSEQLHRSTTDYNDSVNEMDSLTVMQSLPHTGNSDFNQHLNNVITDSIGQVYKADDTARQRINEIQSLQASEARNAGFSLSAKEAIVQQALQLAVETYMLTNAGNLNISQLFKVFKEAKAKMNEQSFHNGDWNTATDLERSIAKKKYDFIFDTTKKGFEARFISMALASEEVHNLLGFNTISPKPSKEKTWFDTANSWLKYAISWLANKYVKLNPSNPVHKQISQLVDNLVKLDIRSRQETVAIWEHAWNLIGKATTPLNVLAKASKDKLAANNFLLNSKYLPLRTVGAIATLDAKAISENIPKAITSMRNELRPNERLGEAMSVMLEASAATGMRKVMDVLIRQGNQNAHERQNISDGTKKSILSWFKEPNKLTKRQHLATTNVILRADLQALTGKFELEEVMDLIGDEATLNNEIKVLEQTIAKETNGNGMLVASKLLAKYMVTGIGGEGLVKSARGISVGLGTHYQQTDVTNVNESLVENIDLLVSMYALKYSYQGDKEIVTSLYKKEPEALLGILNLHAGLVNDAKALFKDNPLNFNKGWLPDIANPYKGIKYAESKEEVETLQSLGWQLVTPNGLKKDPLDTTETKYMMVHNDMAYQRIVSGAVDLGNPSRKGSEVASKWNGLLSPIAQARYANSQKLSKIPYDKFDPFKQEGGLIAAYDTEGYVIGYSYEMEGSTRNSLLDRNNNFADLLGAYAGANFYKPVKEYQSKKVADVLFQDYKDNFKKNPNAYLKLSKDSKDPRVAEMWRMLPHDFKQRAIELYGKGEPIVIRNEAFLLAFGFKKYTVANIFNKLAKDRNAAEKAFVIFANGLLGNPVANMFLKGTVADKAVKVEKAIQDIMRVVKDFIVIRGIDVLWNNVLANLFLLMAHGINPITAIKNWSFAIANVRAYQTQNAELIQLRNDLLAGKDVKQTEQRIGVLEAQLKRNPITKYVEQGLLSSIVEDVTIQDADYTYTSQFKQKVDNATGWIPNAVKTAGNWLILSPSTQGYQFLATTTQLSDFVAKYTLAEHLQKGGMKFDEAVLEASQTFINYDVPTSMGMQYANDMGLFMFTKFFLRIQAVLYKLLDKRMASVIGQQIAVDQFTNFQGVLDPLAVFHIGNSPFEASVFNAHSALFDVGVF